MKYVICFLLAVITLTACSDNGIEDIDELEQKQEETVTENKEIMITDQSANYKDGLINVSCTDNMLSIVFKSAYSIKNINIITMNCDLFPSNNHYTYTEERTNSNTHLYTLKMPINTNSGACSRGSYLILQNTSDKSIADTITIIQDGANLKTSTDFSKDKTTEQLYTHSVGSGIPIILMGNGFGDTEVNDGTYRKTMLKAVENLFSEQPIKALKSYFDIYMIYAVSKQNGIGSCYDTALGATIAFDGTAKITSDNKSVQEYDKIVANEYGITSKENKFLDVVILNTNDYAGSTYIFYGSNSKTTNNKAIAYCPVIKGLDAELYRAVLTHEAIGHGLAKLADEYYYSTNSNIPDSEKKIIKQLQNINMNMNISLSATSTPWDEFLNDTYYTSEPDLTGVYEGADEYPYNVWRPSNNSMMNGENYPFNAPSRKLIYDKVMELSGGKTSTLSQFKAFDLQNAPDYDYYKNLNSKSRATNSNANRHLPHPIIISQ